MKKVLLLLLIAPVLGNSQSSSYGLGFESSSDFGSTINIGYDYIFFNKLKSSYSIGFEYGTSLSSFDADMTGYIGFNEYPNDFTNTFNKTIRNKFGLKFGFEIKNNLHLSILGAYNNIKEFGVFKSDAIGEYWVETSNKFNSIGYRLSLEIMSSSVSPKIGYGSNGFFVGISYLSNNRKLKKYFNDKKRTRQSKNILIAGNNIYDIDLYDLPAMINVFIDDCKSHGIILKPNKIKSTFNSLERGVVAIADGMFINEEIIIKVDPNQWQQASPSKKWYVLYHELGHDYLNLRHGEAGKMMFNYVDREYTWEEFYKDKEYMFKAFKINNTKNN